MNKKGTGIHLLIVIEVVLLIAVILFSLFGNVIKKKTVETETNRDNSQTYDTQENTQSLSDYNEERVHFSQEVEAKLTEMTVEEKVSQLFILTPEAYTGVHQVTVAGNGTKTAIDEHPIAGMLYSSLNFESVSKLKKITENVQTYSQDRIGLDMILLVDEEGGENYSPLATCLNKKVQKSAPELGNIGDTTETINAATESANLIKEMGLTMTLAPCAELVAGSGSYDDRSFSTDTQLVSSMVSSQVQGYENANIGTVTKYFPGRNSASFNETNGWYTDTTSLEEIELNRIPIYQAAVDTGTSCIMVGNVITPALTSQEELPCSLCKETVAYLRLKLGYEGIIMTDSLSEDCITSHYSAGESAVLAVQAGMNLLYLPDNFEEAYQAVLDAVNNGTITMDTLDNSVGRILTYKMK